MGLKVEAGEGSDPEGSERFPKVAGRVRAGQALPKGTEEGRGKVMVRIDAGEGRRLIFSGSSSSLILRSDDRAPPAAGQAGISAYGDMSGLWKLRPGISVPQLWGECQRTGERSKNKTWWSSGY